MLWEAGHLGHASTGERLGVDRFYVADLDADGTDELIVYTTFANLAQLEPSPVLVFDVRDGRLANVTEELFPTGPPSAVVNRDMHFADMNGDSHLDFFLSNHGTEAITPFPGEQNGLYLSDGQGRWLDATTTHLPQVLDFSHGSAVAYVDGDGSPEIHVLNLGGGDDPGNYLLRQGADGRFTSIGDPGSGGGFFSAFFDLAGDGTQDLFLGPVPTEEGWQHLVLLNDGSGGFTPAPQHLMPSPRTFPGFDPPSPSPEALLVEDVTGDGLDDVVAFARYGFFVGSFIEVYVNHADGTLTDETAARLPAQDFGPVETSIPHVQLADVDLDGDLDLLAAAFDWTADPDGGALRTWYYLNDGQGYFLEPMPVPERLRPEAIVFDANADGAPCQGTPRFPQLGDIQFPAGDSAHRLAA